MPDQPRAGREVVAEHENVRVRVGLRPDETPADVQRDIDRSFDFADQLELRGTTLWDSKYRWVGPIKWMAYKEVGPPPWRWPKVGIQPWLGKKHPCVRFIIGWRSTAYALVVMWAGRRNG